MNVNQVYYGDALATLRTWPDEFVDTCVTSPPYFSLRSYLPANHPDKQHEMGSEDTPDAFIARLVEVFREVKRVLKPTGSVWLNISDSYANDGKWGGSSGGKHVKELHGNTGIGRSKVTTGLKPKDLMGIPWRLAMALQADGWYLRDCIVWAKGREYADDDVGLNPMPGSQKDRCTSAYEFIFLLTVKPKYYFDWMAIAEPPRQSSIARLGQNVEAQEGSDRAHAGGKTNGNMKAVVFGGNKGGGDHGNAQRTYSGNEWNGGPLVMPRNVWIFPTRGFKGSHYATFPPELPRRCILAGCPPDGLVLDCFMGSGTSAAAAEELGRHWIGIDLDERNEVHVQQRLSVVREAQRLAAEKARNTTAPLFGGKE